MVMQVPLGRGALQVLIQVPLAKGNPDHLPKTMSGGDDDEELGLSAASLLECPEFGR